MNSSSLIQKVWNFCHTLRDDGLGYGDYLKQLSFLLFLKLAHEYAQPPYSRDTQIPRGCDWPTLTARTGEPLEGLLQKNAEDTKSGAGQYFTPRPLIEAMVACVRPEPGKTIADPACGSGGFFLGAHKWLTRDEGRHLSKRNKEFLGSGTFFGNEIVAATRRMCLMNCFCTTSATCWASLLWTAATHCWLRPNSASTTCWPTRRSARRAA